jgi:hypothetical protein
MQGDFFAIMQCPQCELHKSSECFTEHEYVCDTCIRKWIAGPTHGQLASLAAKWSLAAPETFTQKDCAAMLLRMLGGDHGSDS